MLESFLLMRSDLAGSDGLVPLSVQDANGLATTAGPPGGTTDVLGIMDLISGHIAHDAVLEDLKVGVKPVCHFV